MPAAPSSWQQTSEATSSDRPSAHALLTPVTELPGVDSLRRDQLERLGLRTVGALLFDFPRDYQDMSRLAKVADLTDGEPVSIIGTIEEIEHHVNRTSGRAITGALLRLEDGHVRGVWFGQTWVRKAITSGMRVMFSGTPKAKGGSWEMSHPRIERLDDDADVEAGRIVPLYSLTEGLTQADLRRTIDAAIRRHLTDVEEAFPFRFLVEHDLLPVREALEDLHRPRSADSLARARRRFIFQELFVLQLALAIRRHRLTCAAKAPALTLTDATDADIKSVFPFALSGDQVTVCAEIAADMSRTVPMHRLLQGEVGSGKTAAAIYAMLLAAAGGCQAVLMAPTEILARQHVQTLTRLLQDRAIRVALLTGQIGTAERRAVYDGLADGSIALVVGTQAVLSEGVTFANLGLVIIDEQHRFGVRQRGLLRQAGQTPHYLVMTATPIPRTAALTMYGDLDISEIRTLPPGRQEVKTYLVEPELRDRWWAFVRKKLAEGRQAYVIVPLVEASEATEAASIEAAQIALADGPLAGVPLGIVHGRMTSDEKDQVMHDFRSRKTQVLLATSVVEVGIDVPNATIMTIENAEWFGLAQLHQLRGRVSRGVHPGFVAAFADTADEERRERLELFARSTDGFELATVDFELRGPGDLFGTRQSGEAKFRIADLKRDQDVLFEARAAAQALVAADPDLADDAWSRIRRQVVMRYGRLLALGDLG